ncbi:unnamed protein product [Ilex paraguariensis]|uniref:Uncharacterized protein n=1 Tax=Ilex paraguariensis TaxID=185542 RepID=A0ABC8TE21_9AQUA
MQIVKNFVILKPTISYKNSQQLLLRPSQLHSLLQQYEINTAKQQPILTALPNQQHTTKHRMQHNNHMSIIPASLLYKELALILQRN